MRFVRTTAPIGFEDLSAHGFQIEVMEPGVLCRATYEIAGTARLVPVEHPYYVARVAHYNFKNESPLYLLAREAE